MNTKTETEWDGHGKLRWDDEAWMNWVQFDNESLTGFLPYTNQTAED